MEIGVTKVEFLAFFYQPPSSWMSFRNSNATAIPIQSSSRSGMIHVLEYSPKEGERGVPISVRLHFDHNFSDAIFLRLVVGTRALPTKVRELSDVTYGRWQLDATAPSFESPGYDSDKVLLSVQALDKNNQVIDNVTFGYFSYWISNSKREPISSLIKLFQTVYSPCRIV